MATVQSDSPRLTAMIGGSWLGRAQPQPSQPQQRGVVVALAVGQFIEDGVEGGVHRPVPVLLRDLLQPPQPEVDRLAAALDQTVGVEEQGRSRGTSRWVVGAYCTSGTAPIGVPTATSRNRPRAPDTSSGGRWPALAMVSLRRRTSAVPHNTVAK